MPQKFTRSIPGLLIAFCLVCLYVSCSAYKKVNTTGKYSFEIRFGNTGGVTNINPVFIVKSNGEIWKKSNASALEQQIKKMSRVQVDSVYLLLDKSNFNNLKINEISNYTNYIEVKSEKINNKINWYDFSRIPAEVKELHTFLLTLIKK